MKAKSDKMFSEGDLQLSINKIHPKKGITIVISHGETTMFLPFRSVDDVIEGFSDREEEIEVKLRKGKFFNMPVMSANNRFVKLVGYMRGDLQVQFWFRGENEARFKRVAAHLVEEFRLKGTDAMG